MRRETLVESTTSTIQLTEEEAAALQQAGRRLASRLKWWGHGDEEPPLERSVIQLAREQGEEWRIRVSDAVGLIALRDLQIEIQPKIPLTHLLYLLEQAGHVPRLDEQRAEAAMRQSLWELIAVWYLTEVERLLRRELIKGYDPVYDHLRVVRGRLHAPPTTRAYYQGRLALACEFEEFDDDTPLNRVLKAAARRVAGSPTLERSNRRRALAASNRMERVGELRFGDVGAPLTRTTAHYRDAATLARHVLMSEGRAPKHGVELAWTFLIRTPQMIEEGVRQVLRNRLAGLVSVEKRGCQIVGTKMTLNPDLSFNQGQALADVKYKTAAPEWKRADLYEVVAFAAGFATRHAAVLDFQVPGRGGAPTVSIGNIKVTRISWPADSRIPPDRAAGMLVRDVSQWLDASTT